MKKMLIVRDNRYKLNWGCRATSIALTQCLGESFDCCADLKNLHDINYRIPVKGQSDFVGKHHAETISVFMREWETSEDLTRIYRSIKAADVVVINGEGCQIFCDPARRDLAFSYFIIRLCSEWGIPVFFLNSIMSACPHTGLNQETLAQAKDVLSYCEHVYLRDPCSWRFATELGLDNVSYMPDALFSWGVRYEELFKNPMGTMYGDFLASWPENQTAFACEKLPDEYICVSGASFHPFQKTDHWGRYFRTLLQAIESKLHIPVVAVMPGGDTFFREISEEMDVMCIPGDGNILLSALVLAKASAYVSGRYHPSIMASLGGTPCVFLASNSHKTLSVQEVLGYAEMHEHAIDPLFDSIGAVVEDLENKLSCGDDLRTTIYNAALANGKMVMGLASKVNAFVST